ncbi:hypothetical protein RF11_01987 [Thelohanellus kitauei]|uniref:CCHC-type domain-containing protein n=1 Tax=Thelohanellus kitauei TaxID=669202 RepID=A0A0C2ML91_THEKT|nr:hypothetical protein RF11_01987 [Thelohanellus kitauei]
MIKNKLHSSIPTNIRDHFILNDHLSVDEIVKNAQKLIDKHSQETLAGIKSKDQEYEDRIRELEREVSSLKLSKTTYRNSKRERCTKCGCFSHDTQDCNGNVTCYTCKRRGHISRICPMNRETYRRGRRTVGGCSDIDPMTAKVRDEVGSEYLALVDTGSPRSLIKYNTNKSLYYTFDNCSKLFTVCGESFDVIGFETLSVLMSGKELKWKFLVVKNLTVDAILGRDFLFHHDITIELTNRKCKLLTAVSAVEYTKSMDVELQEALDEYQHIFSNSQWDLGRTNLIKHKIDTGASKPLTSP